MCIFSAKVAHVGGTKIFARLKPSTTNGVGQYLAYLEGKFGDDLGRVKKAMQKLAKEYKPQELAVAAYLL